MNVMNIKRISTLGAVIACAATFTFCKKTERIYTVSDSSMVPNLPDEVYDYPNSSNDYLATLGRVLFYDKELSANKNISCGSCHKQEKAFADDGRFSKGTDDIMGTRNAPSIFPKNGRLFWDGRANSVTDLILRPIRNKVEMNMEDIGGLVDRVATLDYYTYMFKHAFPSKTKVDSNMIKTAMAEFLKNFTFSNTKFAKSQRGEVNLTPLEQQGQDLFMGSAGCSNCHHIDPNSNFGGNSNGYGMTNENHNIGLDLTNDDPGVYAVTKQQQDKGTFMMPVLLNIEHTAPYMHDGRFNTLEEVVEHYNSKVQNNPNLDFRLREMNPNGQMVPKKLNLNDGQKAALVSFLKTLSDPNILTDPKYSDPFVPRVN